MTDETTLDVRGLRCPLPTLRLAKALREVGPGAVVVLLADDPMSRIDVAHFCTEAGMVLLGVEPEGPGWRFRVRRPG